MKISDGIPLPGSTSRGVEAFEWILELTPHPSRMLEDRGIDVINMSFSWEGLDCQAVEGSIFQQKVIEAVGRGILMVASAGNKNENGIDAPADCLDVLSVGGTVDDDSRWNVGVGEGSNYGSELDVVAPAVDMPVITKEGGVVEEEGTSFAAPIVSGLLGLIKSHNPGVGYWGARNAVLYGSDDMVGASEDVLGYDIYHGFGRVSMKGALDWADRDMSLRFLDQTTVSLKAGDETVIPGSTPFPEGVTFDFVRGDVSEWSMPTCTPGKPPEYPCFPYVNGGFSAVCLDDGSTTGPTRQDSTTPVEGQTFYYLARVNPPEVFGRTGSYGGSFGPVGRCSELESERCYSAADCSQACSTSSSTVCLIDDDCPTGETCGPRACHSISGFEREIPNLFGTECF